MAWGIAKPTQADDRPELEAAVQAILEGRFESKDTSALLQSLRNSAQWGESDSRFLEAEALLHASQNNWGEALPVLRRIPNPSPSAMQLLAECLEKKGETYEAAALRLEAARALPMANPGRIALFQNYLSVHPKHWEVKTEMAAAYAALGQTGQAADIYLLEESQWIQDTAKIYQVADWLQVSRRLADLNDLFLRARGIFPDPITLLCRHAELLDILGEKHKASQTWLKVWNIQPQYEEWGIRGMALLRSLKDTASLRLALEQAIALQPAVDKWHFQLAELCLASNDTACAYSQIAPLAESQPDFLPYADLLRASVTGDKAIRKHFTALHAGIADSAARPSPTLLAKVARGHSLQGQTAEACRLWLRVRAGEGAFFARQADAAADLSACQESGSEAAFAEVAGLGSPENWDDRALNRLGLGLLQSGKSDKAAETWLALSARPTGRILAWEGAQALTQAGDTAAAISVLKSIVTAESMPAANWLLGSLLQETHACAEALPFIEESKAHHPEAGNRLAECFLTLGDRTAAEKEWRSMLTSQGDLISTENLWRLGAAANREEERDWLESLAMHGKADANAQLRLGLLRYHAGEVAAGLDMLALAMQKPHAGLQVAWSLEASLLLGRQAAEQKKWDKAIAHLSLVLPKYPQNHEDWHILAEAYQARGLWDKAAQAYEIAAKNPALGMDPKFLAQRVKVIRLSKDPDVRRNAASALALVDSNDAMAQALAGNAALENRDFKEAVFFFHRAARLKPEVKEVWENLGNALSMTPDLKSAALPLQKALDLGSQNKDVFINRARAYRASGDKQMAESILSYLLNQNPEDYTALVWSGRFAKMDGNAEAAAEYYRQASKYGPPPRDWVDLASRD